jgi:hypothetical protein
MRTKYIFFKFLHLQSHGRKKSDPELDPYLDPDPHPLVRGMDPEIRIRIRDKMSRTPNAALKHVKNNIIVYLALLCDKKRSK